MDLPLSTAALATAIYPSISAQSHRQEHTRDSEHMPYSLLTREQKHTHTHEKHLRCKWNPGEVTRPMETRSLSILKLLHQKHKVLQRSDSVSEQNLELHSLPVGFFDVQRQIWSTVQLVVWHQILLSPTTILMDKGQNPQVRKTWSCCWSKCPDKTGLV